MRNLPRLAGLVLCLACHDLPAQIIVPEFGFTYSKTTQPSDDTRYHYREVDFRQGIMAGLGVQVPIMDKLKIHTGLLYTEKGVKSSKTGKLDTYYYSSRNIFMKYIQVPVLFKWIVRVNRVEIYPSVGLTIAYGLGGEIHSSLAFEDQTNGQILRGGQRGKVQFGEYKEGYPADIFLGGPLDAGLQVGVGVLLFEKVVLEVGYNRGIKAFEFDYEEYNCNQNLQMSVGIPFKMNQKNGLTAQGKGLKG